MMVTQFLHMEAKAASLLKSGNMKSAADEEVLSLEEILAEGMGAKSNSRIRSESERKMDRNKSPATSLGQEFNKPQVQSTNLSTIRSAY